jgi:FixJ family two-component response regulator
MSQAQPTVFVVDDDASVLRSLQRLLQSAGWAAQTFSSPEDFLRQRDPTAPGCVILDVEMPGLDGFELQRRLAAEGMPLPVIFLTGFGDVPSSVRAMRAGARNFLCKPVTEEDLLASVAEAVEADRVYRRDNADLVAGRERLMTLTTRERQVLDRVVAGRLNKQTADELGTALKTIKVHRARVMHKMNVRSLAQLARLMERMGVAQPTAPLTVDTGDQSPIGDPAFESYGRTTHGLDGACGGRR